MMLAIQDTQTAHQKTTYQSTKSDWMTWSESPSSTFQILKQTTRKEADDCGFQGFGQDTSLQLHKPGYPASLSLPTHHVLEFHLGNWLSVLHLSLAKVGNSFPLLMERHSHFQSEADERERSGVPLGENRFCIPGLKGLQRWLCHPQWVGNVMRWLPTSVFGSGTQAYWV